MISSIVISRDDLSPATNRNTEFGFPSHRSLQNENPTQVTPRRNVLKIRRNGTVAPRSSIEVKRTREKQEIQCLPGCWLPCSNIAALKRTVIYKVFTTERPTVTVHDTSRAGGDATEDVTCANIDRVLPRNGQVSSENGVIQIHARTSLYSVSYCTPGV